MLDKSLADRYAGALYNIAVQKKCATQVTADLEAMQTALSQEKGLKQILFHPEIPVAEKLKLVREVFGKAVSDVSMNFVQVLLSAHRINYLGLVQESFAARLYADENIVGVRVVSYLPLAAAIAQKISERLAVVMQKKIKLTTETDPAILGGVKMYLDDKVIDGSVAYKLKKLEERIVWG